MKVAADQSASLWVPLTPRGVAGFARASWRRLLLVQLGFALLAAVALAWCVSTAWFPTFQAAILRLPARGEIHTGTLQWPGESPQLLAEGRFISFVVDLDHRGTVRSVAQVELEFGRHEARFLSLFGYLDWPYPTQWIIAFNRSELEPWWGAWKPVILWSSLVAVTAGLIVLWAVLAAVNSIVVWLLGFYCNRDLDLRASWKLAGAALMPGAVLMTMGIVLYGLGVLDVVGLLFAAGAHLLAGWIYAGISPMFVPRLGFTAMRRGNPFAKPPERREDGSGR
jgi:hypothetical protein